jgi:hypothetical protein
MSDDPKEPDGREPVPDAETDSATRDNPKPRRFTLEELLAGMTPDKKPPFEDDWPMGEELI